MHNNVACFFTASICIEIEIGFYRGKMYLCDWFDGIQFVCTTFYGVSAADASISCMARKVCRVTNQNTAIGNILQQQHARKDGRMILTISTR